MEQEKLEIIIQKDEIEDGKDMKSVKRDQTHTNARKHAKKVTCEVYFLQKITKIRRW